MSTDLTASFEAMLNNVPVSLAVRNFMRLIVLHKRLPRQAEILDVGCGDGSFWKVFPGRTDLIVDGIDLNRHEVALAEKTGVYRHLMIGDISLQAPERSYDFVIGNCSMEHIPNIHGALVNIRKSLAGRGTLLLLVPAFGWPRELSMVRSLQSLSPRLEMAAAGALDGFFQHHHIYDATSWRLLVEAAGYEVKVVQGMGAPILNQVFQNNLPLALLEFLYKSLFRRYPPRTFTRRMPGRDFFSAVHEQPVPLGSPGLIEYVLEAVPSAT